MRQFKFTTQDGRRAMRGLLLALVCIATAPAQAQDAEKNFYTGKTVRMIVG